ncbi:MAG: hypothetical protein LDL31_06880 [Prosthecobacter sp.]|nr:hypothetical protein [Prosthecobacter sp.]
MISPSYGASWLVLAALCAVVSRGQAQPYPQPYSTAPQGQYAYPQGQPQYPPQYQGQGGYTQQPSYYQSQPQGQYVSPMEFLPTFGRRFGEMFRRVFYGDAPPAQPYYPPQGRLDQPPQGAYGPQQPYYQPVPGQAPRYETAPAPRTGVPAMPPTSRMNSGTSKAAPAQKKSSSSTSKKAETPPANTAPPSSYRPPAITRETPPPAPIEPSPPATGAPQQLPGRKPADAASSPKGADQQPTATVGSGSFLRGKKAGKPGRVISPYPPYRELDVTGLPSGSLALDPTTQKVFEVP